MVWIGILLLLIAVGVGGTEQAAKKTADVNERMLFIAANGREAYADRLRKERIGRIARKILWFLTVVGVIIIFRQLGN